MGADHLKEFFERATRLEFDDWYLRVTTKAYAGLVWLAKKSGNANLLEPDFRYEVVARAVTQISDRDRGYVWSGQESFEEFFGKCMLKVISQIHHETRLNRQKTVPMEAEYVSAHEQKLCVQPTQEADWGRAIYPKSAAEVIRGSKLSPSGSVFKYITNLPIYALEKWTPEEISEDLKVKVESLSGVRDRARRRFGNPESD